MMELKRCLTPQKLIERFWLSDHAPDCRPFGDGFLAVMLQAPRDSDRPGMGFADDAEKSAEDAVVKSAKPGALKLIGEPEVELVIWERSLPAAFGAWLDDLPADRLPDGRVLVTAEQVRPAVASLLDDASMPRCDLQDAFLEDVVALTHLFMTVMSTRLVDIRLESLSHDGCWKFHRDRVPARLLTTYRGPSTEWVRPADSNLALAEQREYPGALEQFGRYDVGLFKGSIASEGEGIVHRSPPISGSGISRLLLCLNLPTRVSPEPWSPRF